MTYWKLRIVCNFMRLLNNPDGPVPPLPNPCPASELRQSVPETTALSFSSPTAVPTKQTTPSDTKSVYHMSMRELRDTLEAMQIRNAELEEKEFETEQLRLKVDQLQAQLGMTENELQKSRKKCKRLHLELSEVCRL